MPAARAGRKLFSHSMLLPKMREAEMFCKKRVPQFYSAQYLLVVRGAADGSPWSPRPCAVGKIHGQSWDLLIVSPLPLWWEVTGGPPLEIAPEDTLSFSSECVSFS